MDQTDIDTSYDRSNLLSDYASWCDDGVRSAEGNVPELTEVDGGKVYYAGMGASAAPGEVISDFMVAELGMELKVITSHMMPIGVEKRDTVLAVSLSGSTDETIAITEKAISAGVRVIGFSSGGKLKEICEKNGLVHIQLEKRLTSRSSFPLIIGRVLAVLDRLLGREMLAQSAAESWERIRKVLPSYMSLHLENAPSSLARWLYNSPHITLYHSPYCPSLGRRMRNMLSENSKSRSTLSDILEVQHDGISAWESDYGTKLVLLSTPYDDQFVTRRFSAVADVVRSLGFGVRQLQMDSKGLEFFFKSVLYIDLASIFLAMLKKIDPSVTRSQRLVRARLENTPV
ncbi:MAG: SIS domain-containing protein [Conexivisphaerales archaeon]